MARSEDVTVAAGGLKTVRVLSIGRDSGGAPAFVAHEVQVSEQQYDDGEHYDLAKALAEDGGYEIHLSMDHNDVNPQGMGELLQWLAEGRDAADGLREFTVFGSDVDGKMFAEHVRAEDELEAYSAAASQLLERGWSDAGVSFYAALRGHLKVQDGTFPGESVVDISTVLEQPEVFGLVARSDQEERGQNETVDRPRG